jgi:hypothetical protein
MEFRSLLECPLISATSLDEVFRSTHGEAAVQKYRQRIRRELKDPVMGISLGKGGTVQLTNVAVFTCVATAGRWKLRDGEELARVYKEAGLVDLINSRDYQDMLLLVRDEIRTRVRSLDMKTSGRAVARLTFQCMNDLVAKEPMVRNVANSLHQIVMSVDNKMHQIKRLPGQVVRFDGPEAILAVNTGEREELRSFNTDYVRSAGLYESGSPFVLHELRWSPDVVMSVFFPALDLEEGPTSGLEKDLKALEKPLPEPPAELRDAGKKQGEAAAAAAVAVAAKASVAKA